MQNTKPKQVALKGTIDEVHLDGLTMKFQEQDESWLYKKDFTYLRVKKHVTMRGKPVPSRATNFLNIGFKASRQVVMDDSTNIWFI